MGASSLESDFVFGVRLREPRSERLAGPGHSLDRPKLGTLCPDDLSTRRRNERKLNKSKQNEGEWSESEWKAG